ncbi:branched-chain amino acid--2-keto-4-methylthiobutyrate aminotransferase [Pseudoroseomonas deserti]|uniref:Probable branched-chain-amino-acid aminotransferase n=1 Tax=Teichococcus deserti TaxID=1817963 RepID=A0A1V2H6V0_9PROT|nr:aminotransferase class IV [Pseudoroseomonas deserti]ONG58142.1 branched-chain amino acid--2-keto-4-methylthiobutyrate aminotransferase [Pseudoroseomonas deserti]
MSANPFAEGAAYVKGRFVPFAEASIPVTDWGFTRSDAVYDVVHVFQGGFFRLDDHLDRFARAMERRRLAPPEDRAAIEAVLHRCVALSGLQDAYVAMVASRGKPKVAGSRRPADCENHLIAYAIPWIDVIPKDVQERGAHLWLASTPRVPDASVDPTVKNYQWSDLTSGLMEAHDEGYDTAVLCDAAGYVTEGPGFNIFMVKDGRVLTPDRGSLQGITRRSVLELCEQLGIPAEVAPITRAEFEDADEIFAATTAGGVMPVSRLGKRIMGNDRPGPLSLQLKDTYWRRHAEGWHRTPVRPLEDMAAE